MKKLNMIANVTLALAVGFSATACAANSNMKVKINKKMSSLTVMHKGKSVTIKRNQNQKATIHKDFAKTSRKCPPFCIQPSTLAPGVETVGEVEVLGYLNRMHNKGDKTVLVVDSRVPKWVKKGTIPGSVSIPWNILKKADPLSVMDVMDKFNAKENQGLWDFSKAKTIVLFCNGMWCGQSPNNIKQLLKMGYPAHKIKWYRGGMQNRNTLGLTMVK